MKKKILALILALCLLLSLSACGVEEESSGESKRIFTDDMGREVEIPAEIRRIVPSGAMAQIILLALAPDLFAAIASDRYVDSFGMLQAAYKDLPCLGSLSADAELNPEELALADPQLIIDIGEPKDAVKEDLDTLQRKTLIPTVYISATLETMPETYRKLGRLLGREERAEELARFCERVYSRSCAIMEAVGEDRKSCLYILGEEGLNVLAAGSYHAELLDRMTDNLAVVDTPISKGSGNEAGMEQIALWNPEFIIFGPGSIYGRVETLESWQQITAVQNGAYVEVPEVPYNWMSMPPSAQRYLGLIWLPAVLYPEYCDYDVKAEIQAYYRLFYDYELRDEEYAAITANAFLKQGA